VRAACNDIEPERKLSALSPQPKQQAKSRRLKADSSPKWVNSSAIRCEKSAHLLKICSPKCLEEGFSEIRNRCPVQLRLDKGEARLLPPARTEGLSQLWAGHKGSYRRVLHIRGGLYSSSTFLQMSCVTPAICISIPPSVATLMRNGSAVVVIDVGRGGVGSDNSILTEPHGPARHTSSHTSHGSW
jgi:hypothetical protein